MSLPELPSTFLKYFWDSDPQSLQRNLNERKEYITERLLEFGDIDAWRWAERVFGREFLLAVIRDSRVLSPKSANFYAFIYELDKSTIQCLQRDFQSKRNAIWSY